MNIRIIVPLKWDTPFRKQLLNTLKGLGYTWSKGDSLDSDYPGLHKMAYIAINVVQHICSFSSKTDIIERASSACGLNYVINVKEVPKVIQTLNFLKQYLNEHPSDRDVERFVQSHHELKSIYTLV